MTCWRAVEALIAEETGQHGAVDSTQPVGGGSISEATRVRLTDGRTFFVKSHAGAPARMFECEFEGLSALADAKAVRVPKPLGTAPPDATPFIVMEHVEVGRPSSDFSRTFGQQFAQLHRETQSDRFGFAHDNYIGSTPQENGWQSDWVDFFREKRLGYQFDLARSRGLTDRSFDELSDRLLDRLDDLIGEPREAGCLLHGDLWSGNFLCDDEGRPVLVDPAAYVGRREADLAMTTLFGGFDADFYRGYEEVWPLAPGSDERLEVYKLYHLLNHLNLFGSSYRSGCIAILRRFA